MRLSRTFTLLALAASLITGSALFAQNAMNESANSVNPGATMDIIQTATGPGMASVTTLVTAVKAAGLVDTLKGKGPFTVLAPTNEAFAKLPKGTVEDLLKPENKDKLVKILTYHVISGNNDSKVVASMTSARTVEGESVKIMTRDGKVMVSNDKGTTTATVIKPDIKCTNGTIHWIDTVLLPD